MLKFALLLCLTAGACHAQDLTPSAIRRAVAGVESGVRYLGEGRASGAWHTGSAGEVSFWQLTPGFLHDLGMSRVRAARDPLYAEAAFDRGYERLLRITGSHPGAMAAYHRGLKGRHSAEAKAYAQRCMNLAAEYAKDAK